MGPNAFNFEDETSGSAFRSTIILLHIHLYFCGKIKCFQIDIGWDLNASQQMTVMFHYFSKQAHKGESNAIFLRQRYDLFYFSLLWQRKITLFSPSCCAVWKEYWIIMSYEHELEHSHLFMWLWCWCGEPAWYSSFEHMRLCMKYRYFASVLMDGQTYENI